jgi:5-methylcytosine-specific restriction endonuclease McrA
MTVANRPVLVLNKLWTAVGVATLHRAMSLLYSEYADGKPKAQIITPPPTGAYETFTWADWAKLIPEEGDDVILATRDRRFKIPEVILLTRYDGCPEHKVQFSRRHIYKRDNYMCQYCGCRPGTEELTIDHVVPRAQGGETSWTNCVLACITCNMRKADRRPEECGMKLRKQPIKPKYTLLKGERKHIPMTWRHFISKAYWEVPLESDMGSDMDAELSRV